MLSQDFYKTQNPPYDIRFENFGQELQNTENDFDPDKTKEIFLILATTDGKTSFPSVHLKFFTETVEKNGAPSDRLTCELIVYREEQYRIFSQVSYPPGPVGGQNPDDIQAHLGIAFDRLIQDNKITVSPVMGRIIPENKDGQFYKNFVFSVAKSQSHQICAILDKSAFSCK